MNQPILAAFLCLLLPSINPAAAQGAKPLVLEELSERTTSRRAIEAAIWGLPIVSVDAMRQAFFRDAGAKYNAIVFWSKPSGWQNQVVTPDASSLYAYFSFNLKYGPVVLEVPPSTEAGLFGSLLDAWQVPMIDVGRKGNDEGKGAKYILLPPDARGEPPVGYIPVRCKTYNGYSLLRCIPNGASEQDTAKAVSVVKKLRLYPLGEAANPMEQRFVDMAGKLFNAIVQFDETFYLSLSRMLNEEPVQSRDAVAMGLLRSIGIEKGREFKPDAAMQGILRNAAREAHAVLMAKSADFGSKHWADLWWRDPDLAGPTTGFVFEKDSSLDVDARGVMYFLAIAPPAKPDVATSHLLSFRDRGGRLLDGGLTYRLRVSAEVPAKRFWAVTLYDCETAGFIRESSRVGIDSFDPKLKTNADGSVNLYFGPKPAVGHEANSVVTAPGRGWFAMFRFHDPERSLFDKTWKLGDFEEVSENLSLTR